MAETLSRLTAEQEAAIRDRYFRLASIYKTACAGAVAGWWRETLARRDGRFLSLDEINNAWGE